jgi:hypothetical protein
MKDFEGNGYEYSVNIFYDAPHVAFLFMPKLGDGVRTAGDIGMYAQTFLLSLTARPFQRCPRCRLPGPMRPPSSTQST